MSAGSGWGSGLCPDPGRALAVLGHNRNGCQALIKGDQAVDAGPGADTWNVGQAFCPNECLALCPEGLAVFKPQPGHKDRVRHVKADGPVPEAVGRLYRGRVVVIHEQVPVGLQQRRQGVGLQTAG